MDHITKKLISTIKSITETNAFGSETVPPIGTPEYERYQKNKQAMQQVMTPKPQVPGDQQIQNRTADEDVMVKQGLTPRHLPRYLQGLEDTKRPEYYTQETHDRYPELHSVYGLTPKPPIR
jgi:hypothetical protein